jgi:predicted ATPase
MNINKISIKNFRVFKEKTTFQIRPFTILTGPNNSGKSSFIKFLLLLKEGVSKLNFTNGNHNLDDYKSILNWEKKEESLEFELSFEEKEESPELEYSKNNDSYKIVYRYGSTGHLDGIKYFRQDILIFDFTRKLLNDDSGDEDFPNNDTKVLQYINLEFLIADKYKDRNAYYYWGMDSEDFNAENINFKIYKEGLLFNLFHKDKNITLAYKDDIKRIQKDIFSSYKLDLEAKRIVSNFYELINDVLKSFLDFFIRKFEEEILKLPNLKENEIIIKTSTLWDLMFERSEMVSVFDFIGKRDFFNSLDFIFNLSKNEILINKLNYLSPNRGNQKRVLMNNSDKEIDSIIVNFSKRKNIQLEFIEKCFSILGIEGELEVNRYENTISTVRLVNKGKKLALADLGFGYSQIIPIILKVHNFLPDTEINVLKKHRRNQNLNKEDFGFLILEEPEANLHPNLQSKLADLLVYIKTIINIKFIIETHSEYFIRKLQYLTAKKELGTEDSVIYYFNDDRYVSNTEPKVKEIFINQDGGLTDSFGPGFYDEATKLQFDLIKLNKQQLN